VISASPRLFSKVGEVGGRPPSLFSFPEAAQVARERRNSTWVALSLLR